MSIPTAETKIDPLVEKALLRSIEKRNLPRKAVVLLDICNNNVELFGAKGSQQRRIIQEYWNNIRRRSIQRYCSRLDMYNIEYSATTTSLLKLESRLPSPVSTASTSSVGTTHDNDEDWNDDGSDDNGLYKLSKEFDNHLDLDSPPPPPRISPVFVGSPPPKVTPLRFMSPQPRITLPLRTNPPSAAFLPQMSTKSDNNTWPGGYSGVISGTRENPHLVFVDLERSEQNYPFDIVHVPRLEHGGWAREAVDIRTAVGVGDAECWDAWIYDSETNPELRDHSIMVQGRSRSSDYDAINSYHRKDMDSDCAAVRKKQKESIKQDPQRQARYWLLIFPKSMPLDNVIISGDSTQIIKNERGVKRHVGDNKDMEVLSYFVNWVVAKKKTGHQISSVQKKNLEDAFA